MIEQAKVRRRDTSRQKTNDFNEESKLVKSGYPRAGVDRKLYYFFTLVREFSIHSRMELEMIKTAHYARIVVRAINVLTAKLQADTILIHLRECGQQCRGSSRATIYKRRLVLGSNANKYV